MDFPQNWKEIRKTFVLAKSCAGSWATFSSKKKSKKIRLHGFFKKKFWKNANFDCFFYVWSLISQNQDQIQSPWFRVIYKRFIGYIFAQNWRQNFFHTWFFGQKIGWKKMSKNFFSFVAHISQHWRKIEKPFFLKTNSKDVGFFVLIKFSSSSMTPSFFC